MSKVKVNFEFDSIEEHHELKQLMNHQEAYCVLFDIEQSIRAKLKHGKDKWLENEEFCNYLEKLQEMIHESTLFLD